MLAAELALAHVDVAIVERRENQDLPNARDAGLHARTIEILDQRGIADRFLSRGRKAQVASFARIPLDITDFPTRHNYGLALWQGHTERLLANWAAELGVPTYRSREVAGSTQDDGGVDIELADGSVMHANYLAGCDGGRSVVRKQAGIAHAANSPATARSKRTGRHVPFCRTLQSEVTWRENWTGSASRSSRRTVSSNPS
jgi:3-(3-hydroxy-phenyl)propionate hydroxylase